MIYTFGDDIHATAWWYTTAFAMDKKMQVNSTCIFWRRGQVIPLDKGSVNEVDEGIAVRG